MVIAFYPGAGGHRYKLFLENRFFAQLGGNMHQVPMPMQYITDLSETTQTFDPNGTYLTHALNTPNIKRIWPGHEIRKIKHDLKSCLRREWHVVMRQQWSQQSKKQQVGQMFDMIAWHQDYYKTQDWHSDLLIDIATDDSKFGQVMRRELDIQDPDFDFAWDCYTQHGALAPIDDLYDQQ